MKKAKRIQDTVILFASLLFICFIILFLIAKSLNYPIVESPHFLSLCSCCIAMVSGSLVVYQLAGRKDAEVAQKMLHEADFILKINQTFIQDPNMAYVESQLEKELDPEKEMDPITEENRQKFINYLVYLEGLAPLVLNGILSFETIDDLMAYRFFLAMNNPKLQKDQLFPWADYYRGCIKLYAAWEKYRNEHRLPIPLEEYAVSSWPDFKKFSA